MIDDLSRYHHVVGDLFPVPESDDAWNPYRLTDDQVHFFHEQGYVSGIRVLTDDQVDRLRGELKELTAAGHPGRDLFHEYHSNESADLDRVLFHALGAWRVTPGFHDIIFHPAVAMAARQLLGGSVRFWHDQLFCKPARHGGGVAWHQDYSYWTRTVPMSHLTCWIGLDDATRENGCVRYIPGSHRWPLLPVTGLAGDMRAIERVLTDAQRAAFKPVDIELRKGEATLHHPLLVHGSNENLSERRRRATVINLCRDSTRSDTDEPLLAGVPVVPRGEMLGGQFFPRIIG